MLNATGKASAEILLVEDDRFLRQLYHDALGHAGFRVDAAVNGLEALGKLAEKGYDLVITDLKMPGLGGVELYRRSTEKYPGLKDRFLFMSGDFSWGYKDLPVLEKRRIQKPFKLKELLDYVSLLVGR